MKNIKRFISFLLLAVIAVTGFISCDDNSQTTDPVTENIDYAASVALDMTSTTLKEEVTVKIFIDGDTTHFNVSRSVSETGVLKARYLAINTPESTGQIEEYGKAAANFTKEKLSAAESIIVESDDGNWNLDSTGARHLVWVWYRNSESEPYRNLNIEILQNGLAIASSSANNRYGDVCMAAINQAKANKLNCHSGQKDPDFYYGEAVELTLKELRCNIDSYNGVKVAFNGIITKNEGQTVYIEDYDAETEMYYGMAIYYGYNLTGTGLDILSVGNAARIVGTVQYYEAGGTYQVSGLSYRQMKPDDPGNIQMLSQGNSAAYFPVTADTFKNGKVTVEGEDEVKEFSFASLAMSTTVEMKGLKVVDVYTTMNEDSSSYGAMTLTCECDGVQISVRTLVLIDENGNIIGEDMFMGKTIDVKGIVDYYDGSHQIKLFSMNDVTFVD